MANFKPPKGLHISLSQIYLSTPRGSDEDRSLKRNHKAYCNMGHANRWKATLILEWCNSEKSQYNDKNFSHISMSYQIRGQWIDNFWLWVLRLLELNNYFSLNYLNAFNQLKDKRFFWHTTCFLSLEEVKHVNNTQAHHIPHQYCS